MLDVQYASISQEEANRLGLASVMPVGEAVAAYAVEHHQPGCTEPWISRLVGDFVVARGARTVLETGCFTGATSVYITDALLRLGGGEYWLCDIDPERRKATGDRVLGHFMGRSPAVTFHMHGDVLEFLRITDNARFDLAWVDDDHTKPHVTKELQLLYPKMNPGGLILLHDVYGVCDLKSVVQQFGGYSLDLPRLGPAGGLGIIQV
jgi:predicted O-methyltransferase YrrM